MKTIMPTVLKKKRPKLMPYLKKTSPIYYVSLCFNGKKYQRSLGTKCPREAQLNAYRLYDEFCRYNAPQPGKHANEADPFLFQSMDRFIEYLKTKTSFAPGTIESYESLFARIRRSELLPLQVQTNSLDQTFIDQLIEELQDVYKANTLKLHFNRLKKFFQWCDRQDPFCNLSRLKLPDGDTVVDGKKLFQPASTFNRTRWLTAEETDELIELAKNDSKSDINHILLTVLIDLPIRHGEAVSLRWGYVDWQANTILIKRSKNGIDGRLTMSKRLTESLKSIQPANVDPNDFIFPENTKTGYRSTKNTKWFTRLLENLSTQPNSPQKLMQFNGQKVVLHTLRHSWAIQQLLGDDPLTIHEISSLMGHKSLNSTLIYARITDAMKAEQRAANSIDAKFAARQAAREKANTNSTTSTQ